MHNITRNDQYYAFELISKNNNRNKFYELYLPDFLVKHKTKLR